MSLQDSVRRVCGLPQHAPPLCASPRRGAGYALTVIALPMLLGVAALAIDLFARIFGLEGATIVRRSAALSEVWRNRLADGFIFAGETDPAVTGVYVEGSRCSFNGSIHSNTCMSLNGSTMSVSGAIRYRNHYEQNGQLGELDCARHRRGWAEQRALRGSAPRLAAVPAPTGEQRLLRGTDRCF
jgi:hypothetical protein